MEASQNNTHTKPNKDPNQGSSYRPISLLSPIAKTLEKVILPYITTNIPNNKHQHGFKSQHSTTTALTKIKDTIIKGFNKKHPPERTVMVALDMSKAFDTVNIHTLIDKIHQTDIPHTIIKYIANYIKGRKAYTTYQGKTSKQQQIKMGVPQGGVLSPTLFNIYMSDIPEPPTNINLDTYADDITTTTSNRNIETAQTMIQPYLEEIHQWMKRNNLQLNADKSTSTLFSPDPAEYNIQLHLHIGNNIIPTIQHPKVLGLTFDPKLNYTEHIKETKIKANKTINIIKALTGTQWGKQKETLASTYKTITRPVIEYASTVWSPIASDTNIKKLQTIQNSALRIATGCTADTNAQHLHDETQILPIKQHLQLHASQLLQKSEHITHPLHHLTLQPPATRKQKQSIFHPDYQHITRIKTNKKDTQEDNIKKNLKTIHTTTVNTYLMNRAPNKTINQIPPEINRTEEDLPRQTRRTLAQLRTNKSTFLLEYRHKIEPQITTSPLCTLQNKHPQHSTLIQLSTNQHSSQNNGSMGKTGRGGGAAGQVGDGDGPGALMMRRVTWTDIGLPTRANNNN